jgi:hypothetical protein
MRTLILASVITAASLITSTYADASDLNLLCKSELTQPNGAQSDFLRQYEITFATSQVSFYDNLNGAGFSQGSNSTFTLRSQNNLIVVAQNDRVYHEINRITGLMFSKMSDGTLRRGICSPSQELSKR